MKFKRIPWVQNNLFNSCLTNLREREIKIPKALDWGTLASMGIDQDIVVHLTKSMMLEDEYLTLISITWNTIFIMKDVIYKEQVQELYAIVILKFEVSNYHEKGDITLCLGGKARECRLLELAWRYELYTKEEAMIKECNQYILMFPRKKSKDFDHQGAWEKMDMNALI